MGVCKRTIITHLSITFSFLKCIQFLILYFDSTLIYEPLKLCPYKCNSFSDCTKIDTIMQFKYYVLATLMLQIKKSIFPKVERFLCNWMLWFNVQNILEGFTENLLLSSPLKECQTSQVYPSFHFISINLSLSTPNSWWKISFSLF